MKKDSSHYQHNDYTLQTYCSLEIFFFFLVLNRSSNEEKIWFSFRTVFSFIFLKKRSIVICELYSMTAWSKFWFNRLLCSFDAIFNFRIFFVRAVLMDSVFRGEGIFTDGVILCNSNFYSLCGIFIKIIMNLSLMEGNS